MEQDINLVIEDFKGSLMSTVNNCGLPISVIYYVMTDLYKEIDAQYFNYINQARAALSQQVEEPVPAPQSEIEEEKED